MEQGDDKVKVEEASVNLGCVKKEYDEEEFEYDENQYKFALTFENIYGDSSKELRDNKDSLVGFQDDEVIMETGCIKLEDVKEEEDLIQEIVVQSDCSKCGGNYEGYCPDCSSLSHILNNLTPNIKPEPDLNTVPTNVLEIREVSNRQAVFALKTLPKGIIIGPFEGTAPIESTTGVQWKIKDKKLVNNENGNWMKYIESVANHASKNLDVFQLGGILYFETSRKIEDGEELLVCYREENDSDNAEEFYLVPVKKEKYPKVFACTLCCLGFRLERCLVEHKRKCPQGDHGGSSEDFEIIQCRCCKVWLAKKENLESHMLHCLENYNRLWNNLPDLRRTNTDEGRKIHGNSDILTRIDEYTIPTERKPTTVSYGIDCKPYIKSIFSEKYMRATHSNTSEEEKKFKCPKCPYQTNGKFNLKTHMYRHTDVKPFQCAVCEKGYNQRVSLTDHIKSHHSSEKEYKCSKCSFQTNRKGIFNQHLNANCDVKPFHCDICEKKFTQKGNLRAHLKDIHLDTNLKNYKCSECFYQTNYKSHLNQHLNTHSSIRSFQCDICKKCYKQNGTLQTHIRNKHSNAIKKTYNCSECPFQTKYQQNLQCHLNAHIGINLFQCDICKNKFNQKCNLKAHIKNKHNDVNQFQCNICKKEFNAEAYLKYHIRNQHSNINKIIYECPDCDYRTNYKHYLKKHLNMHNDVNPFQCDICEIRCKAKSTLTQHIKNKHSNLNEKEYKCSECSFQTTYQQNLKYHLNTHSDIKPFECDFCKKKFNRKDILRMHIRNIHNDVEQFQCDICKKEFKSKPYLKQHIRNRHSNTNEKKYKCSDCEYKTNFKYHLEEHLNIHKDINPFQCDVCGKRFNFSSCLKVHIKNEHSNTSEKDYKCSECLFQTSYKQNLKQHLNTHSGVKPFQCAVCKKEFTQKGKLNLHMKYQH